MLDECSRYKYLNQGVEKIEGVDDAKMFDALRLALSVLGIGQVHHVFVKNSPLVITNFFFKTILITYVAYGLNSIAFFVYCEWQ